MLASHQYFKAIFCKRKILTFEKFYFKIYVEENLFCENIN